MGSPVIHTNIGANVRKINTSDKNSGSQGRSSQQLRASMEQNRKRNLVNVSQHIMSPNQNQSKAMSEQKGVTRPPSHPGPMKGVNPSSRAGGLPLPPKPDAVVKRTSSYVNKTSSSNARPLDGAT